MNFYTAISAGPRRDSDLTDWRKQHDLATVASLLAPERPLVDMLKGWFDYANKHNHRFESLIGDDSLLGQEWEAIGDALRALLNGDIGRLDGGTVDAFILKTMRENGVCTEHK